VSRGALPKWCFPQFAVDLVQWYASPESSSPFNDPLMLTPPTWFRHLVCCEVGLQLPFFVYALWCLRIRSNAIHLPALVYGGHVCTTMVPILGHFLWETPNMTSAERTAVVAVYSPYLIVPLWLTLAMLRGAPFGTMLSPRKVEKKSE